MSTSISQSQAIKAIDALAKYHTAQADTQLIKDDGSIHLTIALREIPRPKPGKHRFVQLSHPYRQPVGSETGPKICLFTKDPQAEIKLELKSKSIQVTKVLGVSKLRLKYSTFEQRRQLASEYDVFLADDRIVPMLPKALGKPFFNCPRKIPIPITLTKLTPEKLNLALQLSHYKVPSGTLANIYVGQVSSMSASEIVANAMDAVSGFISALPKRCLGMQAIQSLGFSYVGVPMLSFYNQLPKYVSAQQMTDFFNSAKGTNQKKKVSGYMQQQRASKWEAVLGSEEVEVQQSMDPELAISFDSGNDSD